MDGETLQQAVTHKRKEKRKLQDLQRQEGSGESGILVSRFRELLGTAEQRVKGVRNIVLTCVVLHNMLRTY